MKLVNRIITAAVAIAAFVSSFSVNAAAKEENRKSQPESMLILGDSIASGYGLVGYKKGDNFSTENYGFMLAREFQIPHVNFYNYAVDGETSQGLYEKLSEGRYDDGIQSDIVVISIGGNDLLDVLIGKDSAIFQQTELDRFIAGEITIMEALKGIDLMELVSQVSAEADEKIRLFRENIPKITDYIREKNPDAVIILQTLYNPMNTGADVIDNLYETIVNKLNDAINQTKGCYTSDVYTAFANSDVRLIQDDFTHPNSEGHSVIFKTVLFTINDCWALDADTTPEKPTVETTVTTSAVITTTTATASQTTTAPKLTSVTDISKKETDADHDDSEKDTDIMKIIACVSCAAVGIGIIAVIVFINKKRKNK